MANSNFELKVVYVKTRRPSTGNHVWIDSWETFGAIQNLGIEETTKNPSETEPSILAVEAPATDERWPHVWMILKEYGLELFPHSIVRREKADQEFVIARRRTYTREEIQAAELLRITGSSKPFADFSTDESGDSFEVEVNRRLNNRRDFGTSYYHTVVLMSERLKLLLEEDRLSAINCKPVRYDKPIKPETKRLWQFESFVRMPLCRTPRQADDGTFVNEPGPLKIWTCWDDAGYTPAELVFKREEVAMLPSFDIAMTREFVGSPYSPQREIIVTQRFREAMEKHGVKTAEWAPVRLV